MNKHGEFSAADLKKPGNLHVSRPDNPADNWRTSKMIHRLDQHLETGAIFIEDGKYIGKAADGTEVFLGIVGEEAQLEGYLSAYPFPTDW